MLLSRTIFDYEKNKNDDAIDIICESIKFLNQLAEANLAILHLISDCFYKNYQIATTHVCFKMDFNNSQQFGENKEPHQCECAFLQNLLRIWNSDFEEKLRIDKMLYTFLKSYKFKFLFGFSYTSLYDIIMLNNSEDLRSFSVQILTVEDLGENIAQNEEFMSNLFRKLLYITEFYLKDHKDDEPVKGILEKIIFEFYIDIYYLLKPRPARLLSKNSKIIKILVDILCIVQHSIKFKSNKKHFQYEGYQEGMLTVEMYLLNLFSLLATNFDYSDHEKANDILFYLIDTIREKYAYRVLSASEFSFQIPLNRALAIFLNRYAISYSLETNCDLYASVKEILFGYLQYFHEKNISKEGYAKEYPYENLLLDLVSDTLKLVGFLNSVQCKYWVYYGENMLYYHAYYYILEIFYLSDFTLLRLLLSQDFTGKLLELPSLLGMTNINNSYEEILNGLFNSNANEIVFNDKVDVKVKNLFTKNLDTINRLSRNDSYILDLFAYSYEKIKGNKNEDMILLKLIGNEGKNLYDVLKTRILHFILGKDNSIYFSEIKKLLPYYIKQMISEEDLENLINEICDKTESKNRPVSFKIKNDFLKMADLSNILNPNFISAAERFIIEFKQKEIPLLNSPNLCSFNFLKRVNSKYIEFFYLNPKNLFLCVNSLTYILQKISKKEIDINHGIVSNLMKIIDRYITTHDILKQGNNVILQTTELMSLLSSITSGDDNLIHCCRYLYERLTKFNKIDESSTISETTLSSSLDPRKIKMKEMKEKYAAQFKKKIQSFKTKIGEEEQSNEELAGANPNIIKETAPQNENVTITTSDICNILSPEETADKSFSCVICRTEFSSMDLFTQGFGKIGTLTQDSLIYHSRLQGIKTKFESLLQESFTSEVMPSSPLDVNELMVRYKTNFPELTKSLRFVSCNHFIHFDCYRNLVLKYIGKSPIKHSIIFNCPMCKALSNAFIPHFEYPELVNNLTAENEGSQYQILLKGLTFAELFTIFKDIHSQNSSQTLNELNLNFYDYQPEDKTLNINDSSFLCLKVFCEQIISMQSNNSFVLNDFKNPVDQMGYYISIKNFFVNSLILLDILRDDEYEKVIAILKDFVLSLRVLLKMKKIDATFFFKRLLTVIFYFHTEFTSEERIVSNIENNIISPTFFETLFLIVLLFDDSETNFFNIIFRQFLPLIYLQFYVQRTYIKNSFQICKDFGFSYDEFYKILSLPEHSWAIKDFLIGYLRKACLIKSIFRENRTIKDNFINVDEEFNYYLDTLQMGEYKFYSFFDYMKLDQNSYPTFWLFKEDLIVHSQRLFEAYSSNKKKLLVDVEVDTINPSLLLISNSQSFELIKLPENMLELSTKYYQVKCNNCNKCPSYAIVCLICGEKLCFTQTCCRNLGKKKNEYEYKWHSRICGAGNCVFLHLYNGEITFSLFGMFASTKNAIYMNKYGESVKGRTISEEYILNDTAYRSLMVEFKNLSYKKYFQFNQISPVFMDYDDYDDDIF